MEQIIYNLVNNFDFAYMLVINILTYFINKYTPIVKFGTWPKRIVFIAIMLLITAIYYFAGYTNYIILINSAIAAPVAWSWVFKPILNKLKLDYKSNTE